MIRKGKEREGKEREGNVRMRSKDKNDKWTDKRKKKQKKHVKVSKSEYRFERGKKGEKEI